MFTRIEIESQSEYTQYLRHSFLLFIFFSNANIGNKIITTKENENFNTKKANEKMKSKKYKLVFK
jgi:hypothetical protein